jgi:hypothetical protein
MAFPWLDSLSPAETAALAETFAQGLADAGLTVYRASDDRFVPIPPVLSPEPVPAALMAQLSEDARLMLSATVKLAAWTLGAGKTWGDRLYATLTPLEKACLQQGPARFGQVATARVDYFIDPHGHARALELNATIPAMQGYSDLIAHGWIRTVGAARGLRAETIAAHVAATGSNTNDLLASVLWHYAARGGRAARPSILIVSRPGDAQLGELRHYVRAWTAAGHRVRHAVVSDVSFGSDGRALVAAGDGGVAEPFDLVYRHIFARRVDPTSPLGRALVDPAPGTIIINPVVSPLEVKGLLGLLHLALEDAALSGAVGLDEAERAALGRIVPWTRLCVPGPTTLADGTRVDDLPTWVAAHPDRLVLKRSWDYGGKSVMLGPEAHEPNVRARMAETFAGADTWARFTAAASGQHDLFVVQEFVPPTPRRHLLVEGEPGARRAAWRDLFVDVSAYACLGDGPRPRGGACRASGSRIVNILGGGGLTPLLPEASATALAG